MGAAVGTGSHAQWPRDEHVARVRVAVHEPVAEDHLTEDARHLTANTGGIEARRLEPRHVVDLNAVDEFHRQVSFRYNRSLLSFD